ncbi:hypothetical protein CDCA_CDCA14G3886 [Cyanidium caldarium]|uniref:Proteasome activator complex subunit 4 C-terminal domain-containing protein n=1 Tax=Cyanidium caldarium TaxID=2771 RepID=A0AAV9J0E7_CYACA|nr:hypothetical protein CDCA_CDCA14G3886 [Cyanidium caldarium]
MNAMLYGYNAWLPEEVRSVLGDEGRQQAEWVQWVAEQLLAALDATDHPSLLRVWQWVHLLDRQLDRLHRLSHRLSYPAYCRVSGCLWRLLLRGAQYGVVDMRLRVVCARRLASTLLEPPHYYGYVVRWYHRGDQADMVSGAPLLLYEDIFQPLHALLWDYHIDDRAEAPGVDLLPAGLPPYAGDIAGRAVRNEHALALCRLAQAARRALSPMAPRIWQEHFAPRFRDARRQPPQLGVRSLYTQAALLNLFMPTECGYHDAQLTAWMAEAFTQVYQGGPLSADDVDWEALWLRLWCRAARHRPRWLRTAMDSHCMPGVEALAQKVLGALELPLGAQAPYRPERHRAPDSVRYLIDNHHGGGGVVGDHPILRGATWLLLLSLPEDPLHERSQRILLALQHVLALADTHFHPNNEGAWTSALSALLSAVGECLEYRAVEHAADVRTGTPPVYPTEVPLPPLSPDIVTALVSMFVPALTRALFAKSRRMWERAEATARRFLLALPTTTAAAPSPSTAVTCPTSMVLARRLFDEVVLETCRRDVAAHRRTEAYTLLNLLLPYLWSPAVPIPQGDGNPEDAVQPGYDAQVLMVLEQAVDSLSPSDTAQSDSVHRLMGHWLARHPAPPVSVGWRALHIPAPIEEALLHELLPQYILRMYSLLDDLERPPRHRHARAARAFPCERALAALAQLLDHADASAATDTDVLWQRLVMEELVGNRAATDGTLVDAQKEYGAVVRALFTHTVRHARRRQSLLEALLRTVEQGTAQPIVWRVWRLQLLTQACRRYSDADELSSRYADRVLAVARTAIADERHERPLYKAGGKLVRGLLEGLTATWVCGVTSAPDVEKVVEWARALVQHAEYPVRGREALRQAAVNATVIPWRVPTNASLQTAWRLLQQLLDEVDREVKASSETSSPSQARIKAASQTLFNLRRGARWLLSGYVAADDDRCEGNERRPEPWSAPGSGEGDGDEDEEEAVVPEDGDDDDDNGEEMFVDVPESTAVPSSWIGADTFPMDADTSCRIRQVRRPLHGVGSGFPVLVEDAAAAARARQLYARLLQLAIALASRADADTLQRSALRPFELGHNGFAQGHAAATATARPLFGSHLATTAEQRYTRAPADMALLTVPPFVLEWHAESALQQRWALAARAGHSLRMGATNGDADGVKDPLRAAVQLLLSVRGVQSDYAAVGRRARDQLAPACRYLPHRALKRYVWRPLLQALHTELNHHHHHHDHIADIELPQRAPRLESVLRTLQQQRYRWLTHAPTLRRLLRLLLQIVGDGRWNTVLPQVSALAGALVGESLVHLQRRCGGGTLSATIVDKRELWWNEVAERYASAAAVDSVSWRARALAAALLVYYGLPDAPPGGEYRRAALQRALQASLQLLTDRHRLPLRRLGTLLCIRCLATGAMRRETWMPITAVTARQMLDALQHDARDPSLGAAGGSVEAVAGTDGAGTATAAGTGSAADDDAHAQVVMAALMAAAAAVHHRGGGGGGGGGGILGDAAAQWELVGGAEWPAVRDGRLGTLSYVGAAGGECWSLAMLARVRCIAAMHAVMTPDEREQVDWYATPSLTHGGGGMAVTHGVSDNLSSGVSEAEQRRQWVHQVLVAAALADGAALRARLAHPTAPNVWRAVVCPALRYVLDHGGGNEAEDKAGRADWPTWRAYWVRTVVLPQPQLLQPQSGASSLTILRVLHALEAVDGGGVEEDDGSTGCNIPASTWCSWLAGRYARQEREAAADVLAVQVLQQPALLTELLQQWHRVDVAVSTADQRWESWCRADTLLRLLQCVVLRRPREMRIWLEECAWPQATAAWIGFWGRVLLWPETSSATRHLSSLDGVSEALSRLAVTDGMRDEMQQRARTVLSLLAQVPVAMAPLQRYALWIARFVGHSVRQAVIHSVHTALLSHPFILFGDAATGDNATASSFRYASARACRDDLVLGLQDTQAPVYTAAAMALAALSRWFVDSIGRGVPAADPLDDEDAWRRWCIGAEARTCTPHARALFLSDLVSSRPYDVRARWLPQAIHELLEIAEQSQDASAAQVARQCLGGFRHTHREHWPECEAVLGEEGARRLVESWSGAVYIA